MDGRFVQFDVFFILNLARLNQIYRLKPLLCYCRATAGSNSFEFDRAVERRHLKRAIDNRKPALQPAQALVKTTESKELLTLKTIMANYV